MRASPLMAQLCVYLWALIRSLNFLGAGEWASGEGNAAAQMTAQR